MCALSVEAVGISPTAQCSIDALQNAGTAVWIGKRAEDGAGGYAADRHHGVDDQGELYLFNG